jgi:hypothetical protein
MSDKKTIDVEEITKQVKNKQKVLTPELWQELVRTFFITLAGILLLLYIFNNLPNFSSFLGLLKFFQLVFIVFIAACLFKVSQYMKKFKIQTDKIGDIYDSKTKVK